MIEESTFVETVHEVAEIIRTSAAPLSREEILGYFQDMDLNAEQQALVLDYLSKPHEETPAQEDAAAEDAPETDAADAAEAEEEANAADAKSGVFQMYRDELEALSVRNDEELQELYEKLLAGDASVIPTIADSWMRRVLTLAEAFAQRQDNIEDAVQEGNMALLVRLHELCGRGNAAETNVGEDLTDAVTAAIQNEIVQQEGRSEEDKAVVGKAALVAKAQQFLKEQNKTAPSLKELSDYTHLPEEELSDILALVREKEKG